MLIVCVHLVVNVLYAKLININYKYGNFHIVVVALYKCACTDIMSMNCECPIFMLCDRAWNTCATCKVHEQYM